MGNNRYCMKDQIQMPDPGGWYHSTDISRQKYNPISRTVNKSCSELVDIDCYKIHSHLTGERVHPYSVSNNSGRLKNNCFWKHTIPCYSCFVLPYRSGL